MPVLCFCISTFLPFGLNKSVKSLGDLPFAEECIGIAKLSAFFGLIVTSWNALLEPGMPMSMLPCDF